MIEYSKMDNISGSRVNSWFYNGGWERFVVLISIVFNLLGGAKVALYNDSLPASGDAVIFQHVGWYLTEGGRLYSHIFEIKPPVAHETTALLALLTGGDPKLLHVAAIGLNIGAVIISAWGIATIVYNRTNDPVSATTAAVTLFILPFVLEGVWYGFKSKFYVLAFGVLTVVFSDEERWLAVGASSALAAGYWQIGIFFPFLALWLADNSDHPQALLRTVVGGVTIAVIAVAPIVAWGGVGEMIAAVVVIPMVIGEGTHAIAAIIPYEYGSAELVLFPAALTIAGMAGRFVTNNKELPQVHAWLLAWVGWFGLSILAFDYESGPDLLLLTGGIAILVGLTSEFSSDWVKHGTRFMITAVVLITIITPGVGAVGAIAFGPGDIPTDVEYSNETASAGSPTMQRVYWEQLQPTNCYYTAESSGDLRTWIRYTDQDEQRSPCPSLSETLAVIE
jgi:hypothetical protein